MSPNPDNQLDLTFHVRKNVLAEGLNWRGGEVTSTVGTVSQAKAIFDLWKALGHVTHLRWDRKFIYDSFVHEAQ